MPDENVSEPAGGHTTLAWSAVLLAGVAVPLFALAMAGKGGGGAAMIGSLAAFVLAIVARVRHERWALLWLPLLLFPVLAVTAPFWV